MADDHPIPKPRSKNPAHQTQAQAQTQSLSPAEFSHLLTKIAVAQICRSFGFKAIQSSALDSLSKVAALYIESLASRAASHAVVSGGRTQCNLFDIIVALEDLRLPSGFPGAGDVDRPLLSSYTLKELNRFVNGVDEVPFPRRIPRVEPGLVYGLVSFPGKSSSLVAKKAHVPRWLPEFPEFVEEEGKSVPKRAAFWEEETLHQPPVPPMLKMVKEEEKKKVGGVFQKGAGGFLLGGRRERVRFRLGMRNGKLGVGELELRNGICRGGKTVCLAKRVKTFYEEDEDEGVASGNEKS